jgi:hypothetical protein
MTFKMIRRVTEGVRLNKKAYPSSQIQLSFSLSQILSNFSGKKPTLRTPK